ncbi:MAG TPA: hypothetical protein DDW31_05210 [candidate division Zixibacteria bacterium]|jgi:crotonobetainyl-CoA:carnitine CoA-transferase CaiB-like acyl-CoA transferase|nr:hypothetical protein [candidate division Zixibacteria bacterium]
MKLYYSPAKFSATPGSIDALPAGRSLPSPKRAYGSTQTGPKAGVGLPPTLGQHQEEILDSLGYGKDDIKAMKDKLAI